MPDQDKFPPLVEADKAADDYFNALEPFYTEHIPKACEKATEIFTNVRLSKVEHNLDKLTEQINSSPSFGVFLVDLAFSFIPVIGGHIVENALKGSFRAFKQINMGQRKWDHFKSEILLKEAEKRRLKGIKALREELDAEKLHAKYMDEYQKLFDWAEPVNKKIEKLDTKEKFDKVLKDVSNEGVSHPLFEFSTPVINDYFQVMGSKLYDISKDESLGLFAKPAETITFYELNKVMRDRNRNNPAGLVKDLISEACKRQKSANSKCKALTKFNIRCIDTLENLYSTKDAFTQMLKRLPSADTDISYFVYTLSEVIEAAIWIMFLGDPKNWFPSKDPSGKYYYQPQKGGAFAFTPGTSYTPGYFQLQRNLDPEIIDHMLEAFHPDLLNKDTRNFREYYREEKLKTVPPSQYLTGVDEPKGFGPYRVPDKPDYPPEDIRSTSYSADDTALANLQNHFSKMYNSMKSGEGYFTQIINRHLL